MGNKYFKPEKTLVVISDHKYSSLRLALFVLPVQQQQNSTDTSFVLDNNFCFFENVNKSIHVQIHLDSFLEFTMILSQT